jgi:hypothetical protein
VTAEPDPWETLRFWAQAFENCRRLVLCPPEWESRVKGLVDAHGWSGIFTVQASRVIPPDQIIIVDENALEASWRETLQRNTRI